MTIDVHDEFLERLEKLLRDLRTTALACDKAIADLFAVTPPERPKAKGTPSRDAVCLELARCKTIDAMVEWCEEAVERGFPVEQLAAILQESVCRSFDRYHIYAMTLSCERHRWDGLWPNLTQRAPTSRDR